MTANRADVLLLNALDERIATDPLTSKGNEIMSNMEKQYGKEKGKEVFYASKNKGTISGVDMEVVGRRAAFDAYLTSKGMSQDECAEAWSTVGKKD